MLSFTVKVQSGSIMQCSLQEPFSVAEYLQQTNSMNAPGRPLETVKSTNKRSSVFYFSNKINTLKSYLKVVILMINVFCLFTFLAVD